MKALSIIIILGLSLFALRSLLSVPFYTSHDSFTHTARIAAYLDGLRDGQFPVRWAKNLNGQFGSPIFTYSYPLPYFLGSLLHIAGITYESAFRYVMAGGFILSGLGVFFWLTRRFGNWAALVGSLFYLWVPYHFLNVYVRGAIAENLAYAFVPFVLWAIEELYHSQKPHRYLLLLIFSLTGLLLSHNLVSAITLPVFIVWSIICGLKSHNWSLRFLNLVGLAVPFLLTAFIYLPDILERSFIRFDQGISYYADHFVNVRQLLRSRWNYGFDLPGTVNDAMSFEIGLGHLLMLGFFSLLLLVKTLKNRKFLFKKENWEITFFLILFISLLVLMIEHPASREIWEILPGLKTIVDFPWRLLGLVTLIMAYFSSFLVSQTKNNLILVFILIASVLVANRNHLRVNEAVTYGDNAYENYTGTSTAGSAEYTPSWHREVKFPLNSPRVDKIDKKLVQIVSHQAGSLKFILAPNPGSPIRINRFYFPDTQIYHDGRLLTPGSDWEIIEGKTDLSPLAFDDTGLIMLNNVDPKGGEYRLIFRETPLRDFANKISASTLVVILAFALTRLKDDH